MHRREFLASAILIPPLAARGLKLGTVTYNIAKDWDVPSLIKNLTEAQTC